MTANENFGKVALEMLIKQTKLTELLMEKMFQDGQEQQQEVQQICQVERTVANSMPGLPSIENQEDETKPEFIDLRERQIDKDVNADSPKTLNLSEIKSEIEDKPNFLETFSSVEKDDDDEKDDKEMAQMVLNKDEGKMSTKRYLMECRKCGKSYRYRGSYVKHIEKCPKQLKTITALNEHKLVHTEVRDVCQAGFKDKARLKIHHQNHEEPYFECYICGQRLKTFRTWNMHNLAHKLTP
ncbi:zinc finger protein weckle isoform X2 [Drosophila willistoni]|uniref:zinc finger protein weckle isoform X2 n=1 Tax=Drosophila willistoni TaxID=7260 RepID=UPI000C26D5F0|nr:zinc finger protein weckle isoform X2 [Drosophila willistoni]